MVNRQQYNINKLANKSSLSPLKKGSSSTMSSLTTKNSMSSSSNLDTISEENQYLQDRNRGNGGGGYYNGSEYSNNDSGNDLNSEYNNNNNNHHDLAINSIGRFQYILQMDRDMGIHNTSYRIPQNHITNSQKDNQSLSSLSEHTNKYFQFWRKNSQSHIINGSDDAQHQSHQQSSKYYKTQKLYKFICRYIKWPLLFLLAGGILGLIIYISIFLSSNSNNSNSISNYSDNNNRHMNDELIFIEQNTKLYDYNQPNYIDDGQSNPATIDIIANDGISETTVNGHAAGQFENDLENTPHNTIPTTYNTRSSLSSSAISFNIETTTIEYHDVDGDDDNDDNVFTVDDHNDDHDDDNDRDDAKLTTNNHFNGNDGDDANHNIKTNKYNNNDHVEQDSDRLVISLSGDRYKNVVPLDVSTKTVTTASTTRNPLKDSFYIFGFTSGHQNNFGIPIEEDERILAMINNKTQQISTTDSSVYRTRVSPTLPIIQRNEMTTQKIQRYNYTDNDVCQSTAQSLCRGILHYDLTIPNPDYPELSKTDYQHFEHLITSQCSLRVAQFVCAVLEPECRPSKMGTLKPCKRICKSVLEPCAHIIASSEILTTTFDCDSYPNSDDPDVCEDPTRRAKCYGNEFKCGDKSCIPIQWKCDNIKDCPNGEDEENCKFCENDEFKCPTNDKCIPDKWRCDYYVDCPDAADEYDCDDYDDDGKKIANDYSARSYPIVHEQLPNKPNLRPYLTISGEDRLNSNENRKVSGGNDDRDESEIDDGDPIYLVGSKHIETIVKPNISDITTESMVVLLNTNSSSSVPPRARNGTQDFANFQDSKEIMMTSDSESNYKYTSTAQSTSTSHTSPCPDNELRCISGLCITVNQLCDKITDCPDGADEAMCVYDN